MVTASHLLIAYNSKMRNTQYSQFILWSTGIFDTIYSESLTPDSDSLVQEIRIGWRDTIRTSETLEKVVTRNLRNHIS